MTRQGGSLVPEFRKCDVGDFIKCFCGEWARVFTSQAQCKCGITLFIDGQFLFPIGTQVFVCDALMPLTVRPS